MIRRLQNSLFLRWSYECARSLNERSGASVNTESGTEEIETLKKYDCRLSIQQILSNFRFSRNEKFALVKQ